MSPNLARIVKVDSTSSLPICRIGKAALEDNVLSQFEGYDYLDFDSPKSYLDHKSEVQNLPWIIFCDTVALGSVGAMELMDLLKRNPVMNYIPFVLVGPPITDIQLSEMKKRGAFGYLTGPVNFKEVEKLLNDRLAQSVSYNDLIASGQSFADETLDLIELSEPALSSLNGESLAKVLWLLHSIKGSSATLGFINMSNLAHHAENLVQAIKEGNLFTYSPAIECLKAVFKFVEAQCLKIKQQIVLEPYDEKLFQDITLIVDKVKAGWKLPVLDGEGRPQLNKATSSSNVTEVIKSAYGVRVSNSKMDELYSHCKRLQQQRNKLVSLAKTLGQEFYEERFPKDITGICDVFEREIAFLMEFFISTKLVSFSRIHAFAQAIVSRLADELKKPTQFTFEGDKFLEGDITVVQCIENALVHILRNSMDHGLEEKNIRKACGKSLEGCVSLVIKKVESDFICVEIGDDGAGINIQALKAAVAKQGILKIEQLDKMDPDKICDLIFVDGLSTKGQVTDISGRGVGLAAVRESIVKLGGQIKVSSEAGKWTKFNIKMPRMYNL